MKIPGFDLLKSTAQVAANPVGFAADQVNRIIETDESGRELPEVHAFQVKLDRIAALLSFIAERMDPEGYEQSFGTPQPTTDTSEAEPQPEIPPGYSQEIDVQPQPEEDTEGDEGWL